MGRGARLSGVPASGRGRRRGGAGVDRPSLATAWADLDRFEGPGYERILVPVFGTELGPGQAGERRLHTVANLYSPTEAGTGAAAF